MFRRLALPPSTQWTPPVKGLHEHNPVITIRYNPAERRGWKAPIVHTTSGKNQSKGKSLMFPSSSFEDFAFEFGRQGLSFKSRKLFRRRDRDSEQKPRTCRRRIDASGVALMSSNLKSRVFPTHSTILKMSRTKQSPAFPDFSQFHTVPFIDISVSISPSHNIQGLLILPNRPKLLMFIWRLHLKLVHLPPA